MEISVKYLLFINVCLLVITIIITLSLSLGNQHVVGSLPYISDTGTLTPESCIFGQALNMLWVFLSFTIYIKYRQVKDILNRFNMENKKKLNRVVMQIGLFGIFGISIVANFQETNLFYVHWCGAILLFGLGALYQCLQNILYYSLRIILGQYRLFWLRIFISIISVISFIIFFICAIIAYNQKSNKNYLNWPREDGGFLLHNISVIFEWICAIFSMGYITLFYLEFKRITLYEPDVFVEDVITSEFKLERTNEGFEET